MISHTYVCQGIVDAICMAMYGHGIGNAGTCVSAWCVQYSKSHAKGFKANELTHGMGIAGEWVGLNVA